MGLACAERPCAQRVGLAAEPARGLGLSLCAYAGCGVAGAVARGRGCCARQGCAPTGGHTSVASARNSTQGPARSWVCGEG